MRARKRQNCALAENPITTQLNLSTIYKMDANQRDLT